VNNTVKFAGCRFSHHYALNGNIGVQFAGCQLRCKQCFTQNGYATFLDELPRLTATQILAEVAAFKKCHKKARETWLLRCGGGEPLKDERTAIVLFQLLKAAMNEGFYLLIETNCIGVTPWMINELSSIAHTGAFWPDCGIYASLKGIDTETFSQHTKASGELWERSLDGIFLLDRAGIQGTVVLCSSTVSEADGSAFINEINNKLTNLTADWAPVRNYRRMEPRNVMHREF